MPRISVPPRVLIPHDKQAVSLSERVVLSCSVGGDPAPNILWTKNGRPVPLDGRIQQLVNGSLVIYDSNVSNFLSTYLSKISNNRGSK